MWAKCESKELRSGVVGGLDEMNEHRYDSSQKFSISHFGKSSKRIGMGCDEVKLIRRYESFETLREHKIAPHLHLSSMIVLVYSLEWFVV
ncbi:CLUMA_CG018368, isoform A [Clunio marinus]|uniref:CLUMA_CG018368, isoform A n=1 Tax=Clunio marinus TaxID=568069 RepID=A0A1J1J0G9_9DIPT|nr:CLUMA_CG018368, isoform A [Clunio marinus]